VTIHYINTKFNNTCKHCNRFTYLIRKMLYLEKKKKQLKTYFSLTTRALGGQRWSRYEVLNFETSII